MEITLNVDIIRSMIQCAIENRKLVRIQYIDKDYKLTERTVEPTEIIPPHEHVTWGVLCFDHFRKNWRHFKLKGIQRITISDYDFCFLNRYNNVVHE